ncbi:MAG: nodulation protein NfeD, partial [Firmicutes bacterium]|nr:nodulation protein NfeD [Bacillota bacterium]
MRSKVTLFLIFVLLCLPVSNAGAAGTGGREQTVYVIPVYGEIDLGLAAFVKRSITSAERAGAAVLLEINTFGGLVEAATEIRDAVIRTRVPVMSYVSDRAWSAGALIALAAPHIAMAPGSSIGAAEPRPMDEKTVSAIRGEFEATAERAGRDRRIAAAMVDADVEIEELSPKGKLLTLSAQKALEFGYADVIAASRSEALEQFGYTTVRVIEMELGWAERVARLVTNSTVSSLLLTLGFLGLIFEIATPGWGVPGTVGLISLG